MRHLKLDLTGDVATEFVEASRPIISMWPENEDGERIISISIGAAWGAQQRYLTLKPGEARTLAQMLLVAAAQAEALIIEEIEEAET